MTLCYSHRREDPFCRFDKRIVFDSSISLKAKGLLSIAFSRPHDWKFYKSEMMKHCSDGEHSFDSGIAELEKAGYLHRTKLNNPETGKIEWEWHFYEVPISEEEFKKSLPQGGFPGMDNPAVEEFPPNKNDNLWNKKDRMSVVEASSTSEKQSFSKISFLNSKNKREEIPEEKIYSKIVFEKMDWTGEEISYAIDALNKTNCIIHDWFRFLSGTIQNLRNKRKSEQICNSPKKTKNEKKKESDKKSVTSSEKDIKTLISQRQQQNQKLYQELLSGSKTLRT